MANIKLNLPAEPFTGQTVTFTAPCTCAEITDGLVINGEIYTICDALGNCVTGVGGAWDKEAQVSVILDVEKKKAFIQNAATSASKGAEVYTATIGTSWTENEDTGVKSQTVSIDGVTAEHTAKIDHLYTGNGSSESYATFVEEENQYLEFITNGYAETVTGGITFYIFGDVNTVNIPIVVEVV